MAKMVRVNTQVSDELNDKLVAESERIGVPKSTIVTMALETYFQQKESIKAMTDIGLVIQKLEDLEKRIEKQ
ncbi:MULTISPECIES: hypothetical protein [Terrabacteria group]|uniref:hypothetical protein n=1 Tax=Bacillati TaxID=1783272 RepID=UPI001243B3B9|nr:hypothetical protein [Robertmurraya sp. DFI.2.37]EJP0467891.1 hypothetical protein [Escherichia coli]MDA6130720.1 hypothetical protein [Escherichia coli]MDF1511484.1 hypothetical protein [Robertmurraya sp. DFI.2.37]HEA4294853.1 hypothetical protein [Staphylococcus aureus]